MSPATIIMQEYAQHLWRNMNFTPVDIVERQSLMQMIYFLARLDIEAPIWTFTHT